MLFLHGFRAPSSSSSSASERDCDLAVFGSRFWIYGRSGDGTGREGKASGMKDELT
jgi:hypothetical protein